MVIFQHAHEQFPGLLKALPTNIGATGVDLFFVISGVVMAYTTTGNNILPSRFLLKRAIRLIPIYWIMTLFTAALLLFLPKLVRNSVFTVESLFTSLFFIPQRNPADFTNISPMLKLGWTLNYEVFFYGCLSMLLRMPWMVRSIVLFSLFAILCAFLPQIAPTSAAAIFYSNPIIFEFTFGLLIGGVASAGLFYRFEKLSLWSAVMVGLISVVALYCGSTSVGNSWRVIFCGLPAATIVLVTVLGDMRIVGISQIGWLKLLGDASYSIYLAHLYVVLAFRVLWMKAGLPTGSLGWAIIFVSGCVVIGTLAGVALHICIERPLGRHIKGLLQVGAANKP